MFTFAFRRFQRFTFAISFVLSFQMNDIDSHLFFVAGIDQRVIPGQINEVFRFYAASVQS